MKQLMEEGYDDRLLGFTLCSICGQDSDNEILCVNCRGFIDNDDDDDEYEDEDDF